MMNANEQWLAKWLDAVVSGQSTMSQRKLTNIEVHGGLPLAKKLAKQRGVHLLLLTDDRGNDLVAASLFAFKVVC